MSRTDPESTPIAANNFNLDIKNPNAPDEERFVSSFDNGNLGGRQLVRIIDKFDNAAYRARRT